MTWTHTSFSRWAACLAICFSAALCSTHAEVVRVVNGSTNVTAYVETSAGRADVGPGVSVVWNGAPEDVVAYGTNGTFVNSWAIGPGHDYGVFVSSTGAITVLDESPFHTRWFLAGFVFIFAAGLLGWSASFTRQIIGGSVNE